MADIRRGVVVDLNRAYTSITVRFEGQRPNQTRSLLFTIPGAETLSRKGQEFEAEFAHDGSKIIRVWLPGQGTQFAPPPESADVDPSESDAPAKSAKTFLAEEVATVEAGGAFLNPYVMLQMPEREMSGVWGDSPPPNHSTLAAEHLRGTLRFKVTAESPLLLHDQSSTDCTGAMLLKKDRTGKPQLDPTAIKGVLRSAFECASVSRFGVFEHDKPLTIRAQTADARNLRPARVLNVEDDGAATIQVNRKLDPPGFQYRPGHQKPHDVWVPAYHQNGAANLVEGRQHGDEVWARIHLLHDAERRFYLWRASAISSVQQELSREEQVICGGGRQEVPGVAPVTVRGLLMIGGHSIQGKRDERLFVLPAPEGIPYVGVLAEAQQLTLSGAADYWKAVIDSYADSHAESQRHHANAGPPPGRHVEHAGAERSLAPGTLGFARVGAEGKTITGLYPVLIGRLPFSETPREVLKRSKQDPATKLDELSPADRVFGWISGSSAGTVAAHRGHLWVERTVPEGEPVIQTFEQGLELTALNEPKPSQYRFYLKDKDGLPVGGGRPRARSDGYDSEDARIPRKAYWPHLGLPENYWNPTALTAHVDRGVRKGYKAIRVDESNRHREYVAPPGTAPGVSRRIAEWVKPGAVYEVSLRFDGIERELLGLLLWLLTDEHLRFGVGGGKPLGFGTVRFELVKDSLELVTGEQLNRSLRSWGDPGDQVNEGDTVDDLVLGALSSMPERYRDGLGRMRQASNPPDLPVHYPRRGSQPVATSYQWFTQNEAVGHKALPDVSNPGLPYN